jgi:hypothetical protein
MREESLPGASPTTSMSLAGSSVASAGGGEPATSSKNSCTCTCSENPTENYVVSLPPSPPGVRTRLYKGIRHPKQYTNSIVRYGMLSSTCEPYTLTESLNGPNWCRAMEDELIYALLDNKTWHLV